MVCLPVPPLRQGAIITRKMAFVTLNRRPAACPRDPEHIDILQPYFLFSGKEIEIGIVF